MTRNLILRGPYSHINLDRIPKTIPPEPEPEPEPPFALPEEPRFEGHWIVAQSGTGKTNLLLHMVFKDLKNPRACVILMDSKGA
jgi:hypothetical protein